MEPAPEEVAMECSRDHSNMVVKGKRTKRLRPQSPIPFAAAIASNHEDGEMIKKNYCTSLYLSPSSSSSSKLYHDDHSTDREKQDEEEEVDMANCLILLAQGQSKETPRFESDDERNYDTVGINNNYNKLSGRKLMEGGKGAGYSVYDCKTCNRSFPSFQALGGHRASHKKPKSPAILVDHQKTRSADDQGGQFVKCTNNLTLQLSNNHNNNNNRGNLYNKANKVHECSICGAEFSSGQALGGHMRRHRGPIGSTTNTTTTTLALAVPIAMDQHNYINNDKPRNNVLCLDLDLNLPAPEDDHHHHHRESKFPFASKQQQQQQKQPQQSPLVFSSPPLVDCHY